MPNRALELEWESAADSPRRTELIEAALVIADESGLEAVSVRRVAQRVGCRPMSLYSHVPSKQALVALMFDRISANLLVGDPLPANGRELLRGIACQAFETYLAHPWMLHAFGYRPPPGPNQLRRAEQSATAVANLGVDTAKAWTAVSIVHEWTMGRALHAITLREDDGLRTALDQADPAQHPAAVRALEAAPEPDAETSFSQALETVLDAIDPHVADPQGRR